MNDERRKKIESLLEEIIRNNSDFWNELKNIHDNESTEKLMESEEYGELFSVIYMITRSSDIVIGKIQEIIMERLKK